MGFWDTKTDTTNEVNQRDSYDTIQTEVKANHTEDELKEAFLILGTAVFEAEKDDTDSKYSNVIKEIKKIKEKEMLWDLYKLSLEGKTKCDSCGAIITSDSAFCNKCGASVPERDFSPIGIGSHSESSVPEKENVCPKCGKILPEGAVFCEKCGARIGSPEDDVSDTSNNAVDKSVCPKCGAPLVAEASFCEKCGEKI